MADIAVIKDFHLGIGDNEFVGIGDIVNCDTQWRNGITRINLETVNTSAGTVTGEPMWIVGNSENVSQLWAYDTNGTVYRGTTTAGSEEWSVAFDLAVAAGSRGGLTIWKDHLLVMQTQSSGDSILYGYGPLSGSAILYTINSTIDTDNRWHPMIVGQDDIVYGGAGRYIFSLQEVAGQNFQAGTAATFTMTTRALDLPEGYRIRALSELGKNLMIGTWKGQTDIYENKIADIFPWDRTSDSFDLPIKLSENGIHAMITEQNSLYFFSGTEGKLFITDGSSVRQLMKIPQQVIDLSNGAYIEIAPGAMISHNNKIVFGIQNPQSELSQVWSYNLENGALLRENTSSRGTSVAIRTGALWSSGRDDYWIGLENRIDRIRSGGSARRYTDYSAYVTSRYIELGNRNKPTNISEIEIILARPLVSGQGIRLNYRTDLSASFTRIPNGTIDFTTYGAIKEQNIKFDLEVLDGIQIRAELTTGSGVSNSPELRKIILR